MSTLTFQDKENKNHTFAEQFAFCKGFHIHYFTGLYQRFYEISRKMTIIMPVCR